MKSLIFLLPLICACAYGTAPNEQQHYGTTKGNQAEDSDAGSPDYESDYDEYNDIPQGCFIQVIREDGVAKFAFVMCNSVSGMSYKYLVDPCPFKEK